MRTDLSLYLVTDPGAAASAGRTVLDTVALAVASGVTAVQVRYKHADARSLLALAVAIGHSVPRGVSVIVNDRVDVFLAARRECPTLAGVHVGQGDLPPEHVRALVGSDAVIGVTASTHDHLQSAAASPARVDYVGIGVVRATATKPDATAPLGVDGILRLAASCPLPAVAIGGITTADVPALRRGGLAGIAVASAIGGATDPGDSARRFTLAWSGA
ncbi:thiamine phosphate synthase [Microbacterium lacticum]